MFGLKIKDVDCDFRIMRSHVFNNIKFKNNSGVICIELVKKLQDAGYKFAEVAVHHYHRTYGKSQFFNFRRIFRVGIDIIRLWLELVVNPR